MAQVDVSQLAPKWRYGTAAPTTGTWNQGDVVWNRTPSAAGDVGWVCVTAGTPGTWKSVGTVEA